MPLPKLLRRATQPLLEGTHHRPQSATRRVAGLVADRYRAAEPAVKVHLLDLTELPLDAFSPLAYTEKPAALDTFISAALAATGVVVVTPEYNGSFPGALKYFIDLLPFPAALARKPVCFVGLAEGQWGGVRAVEQLQQIFAYRQALMLPDRVFIPRVGEAFVSGAFVPDHAQRLSHQAERFLEFIRRNACA